MRMDSNNIKFVIKKKVSFAILFITMLYVLMLIYMMAIIIIDNNLSDVFYIILLMSLFLFLFVDNLCWQLNGKEIISFEKTGILIVKKGRLLNGRKFICFEDIDDVYYEKMSYSAWRSWGIFWGRKGGCIKIEYKGTSYCYFGQSISYEEAMSIIPEIKNHIDSFKLTNEKKLRNEYYYYEKMYRNYLNEESEKNGRSSI